MTFEYEKRFTGKGAVDEYVAVYADDTSYANLLYMIEKDALTTIVKNLKHNGLGERYLDFATGTGRIVTHLEICFPQSEGIDISPEMAEVAKGRVVSSQIRCADITKETPPDIGYDLITAFRFFLNAEPALRESVMRSLSKRLRNSTSRLVVNNHGRIASVKYFSFVWQKYVGLFSDGYKKQVFLGDKEFENLLGRHGLRVESEYGYSILGGRIGELLGYRLTKYIENIFFDTVVARLAGTSKIYVIKRILPDD